MIQAADFREMVRTIQKEYAGAEELQNPEIGQVFSSVIGMMEEMHLLEDDMFCNLIQVWLATQGVHKVRFSVNSRGQSQAYSRGFTTRGTGEELWVDTVSREDRLRSGDRILTINGDAPAVYRAKLSQRSTTVPISDRDCWEPFLNYADHIELQRKNGSKETVRLRRFPIDDHPVRILQQPAAGALTARIDLVNDGEDTAAFMKEYSEKASSAETIILDLRHQRGEGLSGYRAFVESVVPTAMTAEKFWGKRNLLVRYSETNTDRLTDHLQRMKSELPNADPEFTAYLDDMITDLREKRGRGLIPDPDEELEEDPYEPGPRPERVILLTDSATADDAEWFAQRAAQFENVTLIGRETSGDYQYDYPAVLHFFKGIELMYPVAKSAAVQAAGECRGVRPEFEIPWTSEETVNDVILNRALNL